MSTDEIREILIPYLTDRDERVIEYLVKEFSTESGIFILSEKNVEIIQIMIKMSADNVESRLLAEDKHVPIGTYSANGIIIKDAKFMSQEKEFIFGIHEPIHRFINASTPFGNLLSIYSILPEHDNFNNGSYSNIYNWLSENSIKAHETFATWFSINKSENISSPEKLTENDRDYLYYYYLGESLVENIPGSYNKGIIMSVCLNFCFSSLKSLQKIDSEFDKINFSDLIDLDYPDHRLIYIAETLGSDFFKKAFEEFFKFRKYLPAYNYIEKQIRGEFVEEPLHNPPVVMLYQELSEYLYNLLQKEFNKLNSFTRNYAEAYALPNHIRIKVNEYLGMTVLREMSEKEYPIDRSLLINLENFKWIINEEPEICEIIKPENLPVDLKRTIFSGENEPGLFNSFGDLVLMMRSPRNLVNEFKFENVEDKMWLDSQKNPITFLSSRYYVGDKRKVIIIPFDDPEDLRIFFASNRTSLEICCCVYYHIIGCEEFLLKWDEIIYNFSHYTIFFNDLSFVYLLEKDFFFTNPNITYCEMDISFNGDTSATFIVCLLEFGNDCKTVLVVTPCTKYFIVMALKYLGKNKNYIYDKDILDKSMFTERKYGSAIFDVVRQAYLDHSVWFKTSLINESYY
ncbi:hypothetical protein AM493_08875 [Flavobacterium akiainvivens]|uniref:Uncharacterized protein n=1 Tax=Flavobacterium akiainvivens TaxID=1202724 RepID=A0A0M9VI80_9FLAO|nr:hypothetical protein [Flavobacterium akiainvivens]KOS06132.1 hypothetical protein AM493_08875 [Flavobacterium akiainvivens]SFQ67744.1 hypothetical protein SAMN05444144_1148 [Flavobacterium akiainvivens]